MVASDLFRCRHGGGLEQEDTVAERPSLARPPEDPSSEIRQQPFVLSAEVTLQGAHDAAVGHDEHRQPAVGRADRVDRAKSARGERRIVLVDARDGSIADSIDLVQDVNVLGAGLDVFGVERPINVFQQGGTFFLVDTSKPMFDPTSSPPATASR